MFICLDFCLNVNWTVGIKKNKKSNYLYQYRWNTLQVWGNFNSVLKAVAVACSRGLVFCNKSNESVWFLFKHFHRCSPSLEMSIAHRSHLILKQTMPDTQLPNTYLVHIINRMCIFLNSMYCVMLIPNWCGWDRSCLQLSLWHDMRASPRHVRLIFKSWIVCQLVMLDLLVKYSLTL